MWQIVDICERRVAWHEPNCTKKLLTWCYCKSKVMLWSFLNKNIKTGEVQLQKTQKFNQKRIPCSFCCMYFLNFHSNWWCNGVAQGHSLLCCLKYVCNETYLTFIYAFFITNRNWIPNLSNKKYLHAREMIIQ